MRKSPAYDHTKRASELLIIEAELQQARDRPAFSSARLLAKIASELQKPDGLTVITYVAAVLGPQKAMLGCTSN